MIASGQLGERVLTIIDYHQLVYITQVNSMLHEL